LLIVSNRLPVTVSVSEKDGRPQVRASVGGLATGLRTPHEQSKGLWLGWPGDMGALDDAGRQEVRSQLESRRLVSVELAPEEVSIYYDRIANSVLWPVCHDRLDQLPLRVEGWDVYERVNARFADAVAAVWRPGDRVWVHDYHLMRVPALIRERIPNARIGFFLHIPFPTPEIFFALARRRWLVAGMLGADLIGFHTRRHRGHFAAAVHRLLGADAHGNEFEYRGRRVRVGVFPMGIDARDFARRAESEPVLTEAARLRRNDTGPLLVGIDRLDYSKGIPRRLLAVEQLLIKHPEWRERIRFLQIAVPSREGVRAYRQVREEVESLVGRINGMYAVPTWAPIQYVHRGVSRSLLIGLYRAADVMVVTPVRDGMNLVAKEFVAARTDDGGVLVLSEFAGAAEEMNEALIVNPYDVDETAEAMHTALVMSPNERAERMRALRERVTTHDVARWANEFLDALGP
jgi:trehalose 6-phosphate synthase/phosphatase